MRTHKIGFYEEISKIITKLSLNYHQISNLISSADCCLEVNAVLLT